MPVPHTVTCSNPECSRPVRVHAQGEPRGVYCSIPCWQVHHYAVGRVRDEQRMEARDAIERRLHDLRRRRNAAG